MPRDSLTLRLNGTDVPLRDFAIAMNRFSELLRALGRDVASGVPVEWTVAQLDRSSAIATVIGSAPDMDAVERVVAAYETVGDALVLSRTIPYSPPVLAAAHGLTGILNGKVDGITFETADREATVRSPIAAIPAREEYSAFGAISGRIQTLTNRGALRFTLYDLMDDRAVSCYLAEGRQELMRDAWGRLAVVEGIVHRDGVTGRPMSVRRISDVTMRAEGALDAYLSARGAAPALSDLSPEDAIRRLRDA